MTSKKKIPDHVIEQAKANIEDVIGRFVQLKRQGNELVACCPFHDEKSPSFTVTPHKGFFYCFGCGASGNAIDFVMNFEDKSFPEAIERITGQLPEPEHAIVTGSTTPRQPKPSVWRAIRTAPADAPAPNFTHYRLGSPSTTWCYRDTDGAIHGYVCRFDIAKSDGSMGKETVPLTWAVNTETGSTAWRWLSFTSPRPMYGLEELAKRPKAKVLLVEGEKTRDAAARIFPGFIVLTWPGGGKAVSYADFTPLAGRVVTIWPDWDWQAYKRGDRAGEIMPEHEQPGVQAMREIWTAIKDIASGVRIVPPMAGTPNGWDLADEPPAPGFDPVAYGASSVMAAEDYFANVIEHPEDPAAEQGEIIEPANDNQPRRQPTKEERAAVRNAFLQEIQQGGTLDSMEALAERIKFAQDIAPSDREVLAKAIQSALKDFADIKLPIPTIRGWVGLAGPGVSDVVPMSKAEIEQVPDWVRPWTYRQDTDQMFNLESKVSITTRAFDFEHNRLLSWEMRQTADMSNASEFCRETWHVPILDRVIYMPMAPVTFLMDGLRYGNSYRHELVPIGIPQSEWSQDAHDGVNLVRQHLERIIPDPGERAMMTMWLAHNVQRPGDKINWAPIIVGNYGDGKSVLADMLGQVMGKDNVKVIGGETLVDSNFNGWAEGSAVVAIEEVRISGHNRYEVMDRLKPLITNTRVPIHAKHRDPYTVPNVVNYIMFSNHLDAVPIDDKDRRYFVLATPFVGKSRDTMRSAGLDDAYFTALFDAVARYYREIRGWLESVNLETFKPKGNAPATEAKKAVVEFCRSDDELAIADILEDGAVGVTRDVFSSTSLIRKMEDQGLVVPRTSAMNRILQQMGYSQIAARIKWNGDRHRIWHNDNIPRDIEHDRIRTILDGTRYNRT